MSDQNSSEDALYAGYCECGPRMMQYEAQKRKSVFGLDFLGDVFGPIMPRASFKTPGSPALFDKVEIAEGLSGTVVARNELSDESVISVSCDDLIKWYNKQRGQVNGSMDSPDKTA